MTERKIIKKAILSEKQQSTNKTKHYFGNIILPSPYELRIVKFNNDPGFYLFYCDESGLEMTDTYHDTMDQAEEQACFEFLVQSDDWEINN